MGLFATDKQATAVRITSVSPNRRYESSNKLRVGSHSRGGEGLTAAGFRVTRKDGDKMRRLIQPWQARAYSYYDIVPEIKYAAQFYSRALSVLRLYVAKKNPKGEFEEIDDPNDPAVQHLERMQDPGGGRSNLLGSYGRLMFLGGEAYLLVSIDADTGREQWEMLSPDELRVIGSQYTRFKAPSLAAENLHEAPDDAYEPLEDDQAVVYRLWKRHPRFSMWADSTMQGVLDVAEELVLLTQAVRARARSRIAGNGILLINGKVTVVPLSGDVADDAAEEDPFVRDLVEAMTAPIVDEGTASAVVPLVARIDSDEDVSKAMHHLQLVDPTQLYPETGLRRECIERLGIGLDMPAEVLTGMAGSNHWTGWIIDDSSWRAHIQPVAQQLVEDLTGSFFHPTLEKDGIGDWADYAILFDPSAAINHPDRGKDAKDLYDSGEMSGEGLREATGFDESVKPSEEERNRYIGIKTRDSSLAVYGIPSLRSGGIEPVAGEVETGQGTVDAGSTSAETEKKPPDEPAAKDETSTTAGGNFSESVARILGASDLALQRARELAGSRLRNLAKRDEEAWNLVKPVRNGQVAAKLGRDRARALRAPSERELVAGARELIADALAVWGIDTSIAEPLGERIEQHAARTLYDERPTPLPSNFENYVRGLKVG